MNKENFVKLMSFAEADAKLPDNFDDLMNKNLQIPSLIQRWTKVYTEQNALVERLRMDKGEKYGKLVEFYRFHDKIAWPDRQIDGQINSNADFLKICRDLEEQKFYLEYIKETLANIKGLSFQIKNYLDYKKIISTNF